MIDPSVERPGDRAALVDEMNCDVPLPSGFSTDALVGAAMAQPRYVVGAGVMGAVACGWIESWIAAKASSDSLGCNR